MSDRWKCPNRDCPPTENRPVIVPLPDDAGPILDISEIGPDEADRWIRFGVCGGTCGLTYPMADFTRV